MKKISRCFLNLATVLALVFALAAIAQAQTTPAAQPTDEQQQKEKAEKAALEKKALALLDQVIADAPSLKLPENRVRLQITAADLIWDRNEARARTLFTQATENVAEMIRTAENKENPGRRNVGARPPAQLRQELVMAIARHDAALAYQALASTRSLTPAPTTTDGSGQVSNADDNLEQMLLSRVATLDPKLALQNAEQFLDKGEFPRTLPSVLYQLQRKDKEGALKLEGKLVQSLQSANLLANMDAGNLAITLLAPGPRETPTTTATTSESTPPVTRYNGQLLSESSYQDVLRALVEAALRATPAPAGAGQRGNANPRARRGVQILQPGAPVQLSDAEAEQANARRLLAGVQTLLPKIDQYLPDRAQAIRQKTTETGSGNNRGFDMRQMANMIGGNGDSNSLEAFAASAPPQLQPRIYQQAAMKALDEGNADRARSIANDHLESNARAMINQAIDVRLMADKIETARIEEIRQAVSNVGNDNQRIAVLLQLANAAQKKNPKLTRQLIDDALRLVARPATDYAQMEAQVSVVHSLATLDPARSFQILEPGIQQLNELLAAATVLNGFEVNVFRDGELPLQPSSGLGNMVNRYAQELAVLARTDFERTQTLVNRFQLPEPRIQARLAIAQSLLRPQVQAVENVPFGGAAFGTFIPAIRRP